MQRALNTALSALALRQASWKAYGRILGSRNGCLLARDKPPHYLLNGMASSVSLYSSQDLLNWTIVNKSFYVHRSGWESHDMEAATPPVRLDSGDYIHFYAGCNVSWGALPGICNGKKSTGQYMVGYIIMSGPSQPNCVPLLTPSAYAQ